MHNSDWLYWSLIKRFKKGRSLERWALRHLHQRDYLNSLAEKIVGHNKRNLKPCYVQVESIWIDGTPQAHGVARSSPIKCELADLLYIVEEFDHLGEQVNKVALLIQGKNTVKVNKIDSGSSTRKERTLLEKLDRSNHLILKSGVKNSSKEIGRYLLNIGAAEGLSDCARFLLMPKGYCWFLEQVTFSPFHVTWPKSENSTHMKMGCSLNEAVLKMYCKGTLGRKVVSPTTCQWSKMINDLENKYLGVEMSGYDRQKRHYASDVFSLSSKNASSLDSDNLPYIPIIKVKIQYPEVDYPYK